MAGPEAEHRRILKEVEYLYPRELYLKQGTKEWHMQRRGRLTGSNLAAAAGLNPYRSRMALYDRLTGRKPEDDLSNNPMVQWGNRYEDQALDAYGAVTGHIEVQRPGMVLCGMDTWLAVSPDGWAGGPHPADPDRGRIYVEAKCPGSKRLYNEIPDYYMPQVQGGLSVTRRDIAHFFCYVPRLVTEDLETGDEFVEPEKIRIWEVGYSEAYAAKLRSLLREFMCCVVTHTRPGRLRARPVMPPVDVKIIHDGPVSP